jgi:hypothetical protein
MKISIERNLNRWKTRICDYLNQSTKNWSNRRLKVYGLLFVLAGMTLSLEITVRAVLYAKPTEGFSRPHSLVRFMPQNLPDINRKWPSELLSKIRNYKEYLDSLSLYDSTRYRALLKSKPFLLDSLQELETFLIQHIKK